MKSFSMGMTVLALGFGVIACTSISDSTNNTKSYGSEIKAAKSHVPPSEDVAKKSDKEPLSFDDYLVDVSAVDPKPIDFDSNPKAKQFRTKLNNAHKDGVNFAGGYILTSWGCGTGCQIGAIIDAKDGEVYFPKELGGMGFGIGGTEVADKPIEYRKDSSLLIIRGIVGGSKEEGTTYLEWQDEAFKNVNFVDSKN